MPDRLIDTNILVYAYDSSEGEKHEIAKDILRQIWIEGGGVVCLQNLMEFFVIITQKVENPIDIMMAKDIVYDFIKSERWTIIDRDADTFLSAIELVSEFDIHLWDAAIAASMKENNLTEIVTENEKDFRKVPDIKVVFPF
ncbi:MAG: PIN domain-containing protein [Nitrospirae bacterium]|nr:PIN domain-containing protein [Nitrospirota bacterium]